MYPARLLPVLFILSTVGQDFCPEGDRSCSKLNNCVGKSCETVTSTVIVLETWTLRRAVANTGDLSLPTTLPTGTFEEPDTRGIWDRRTTTTAPTAEPSESPTGINVGAQKPLLPSSETIYISDPNGPHRCARTTVLPTASEPATSFNRGCNEHQQAAIDEANAERNTARIQQERARDAQAEIDAQKAQLVRDREELDRQWADLERRRTQNQRNARKNQDDAEKNIADKQANTRRAAELDNEARAWRADREKLLAEQKRQEDEASKARANAEEAEADRRALDLDRQRAQQERDRLRDERTALDRERRANDDDLIALDLDRKDLERQKHELELERDYVQRKLQDEKDAIYRQKQQLERDRRQDQQDRDDLQAERDRLAQEKADWETETERRTEGKNERKENTWNGRCGSPLHAAARRHDSAEVKRLLDGGASIELRDEEGSTPLHCAYDTQSRHYDKDALKKTSALLLDSGADYMAKNHNQSATPLELASWNELEDPLLQLCKAFPRPRQEDRQISLNYLLNVIRNSTSPLPLPMLQSVAYSYSEFNGGFKPWQDNELRPFGRRIDRTVWASWDHPNDPWRDHAGEHLIVQGVNGPLRRSVLSIDILIDSRQKIDIWTGSHEPVCWRLQVQRQGGVPVEGTAGLTDGPVLFCERPDSQRSLKHRTLLRSGTQHDAVTSQRVTTMSPEQIDRLVQYILINDTIRVLVRPVNNQVAVYYGMILVRYMT